MQNGKNVQELALVLKQVREQRRLMQLDVAQILGVTPTTYNRWEKGLMDPEPDRELYKKLMAFLKMTPSNFNEMIVETRLNVKERRQQI